MRTMVIALLVSLPLLAQDPAKVGPDIYKCILDNARIRVCEVAFKPGASVALHSHPQHLIYVTAPGKLRITPAGGTATEVEFKAGQALWSEADAHSAINPGKTELRGLVVELKDAPRAEDPVVGAILQMERDWLAAMVSGNWAYVENVMADDWMLTDPMGQRQNREQAMAELRSGALKFESSTPSDLKVTVYGDTAVANGRTSDKGTYKGMDISGNYAFTDVFVKRDGKWRAVSSQVTRVSAP